MSHPKHHVSASLVFTLFILNSDQICSAEELKCIPTITSHGVIYTVPVKERSGCSYSWSNSSDHVIANSEENDKLQVIASNISSLYTYRCDTTVKYSLDCPDQQQEKQATCNQNCSQRPLTSHPRGSANETGRSRYPRFVPWIVSCVLLLRFF